MMDFYRAEKVKKNITAIHSVTGEIMYLINGRDQAILVDTCLGVGHLCSFVETLTHRPVTVLLTHGHMDHAMGAPEFDDVYMNPADRDVFLAQRDIEGRKEYITMNPAVKGLNPFLDEDFVPAAQPDFKNLEDGAVFELGGTGIEAYALPGHTRGSMVFLIREERILILGDACNNSTFLFDENSLHVSDYKENLLKAKQGLEGWFDRVFLSHHVMETKPDIISNVIEVCNEVQQGKGDEIPFEFMGQKAYIAKKCNERFEREDGKAGNIIYRKDK